MSTLPGYLCSPPLATTPEYNLASCARRIWPPPLCRDCCSRTTLTSIPLPHPSVPCPEYRQYQLPQLRHQDQGCPGICARPHWPPLPSMTGLAALAVFGLHCYAAITAVGHHCPKSPPATIRVFRARSGDSISCALPGALNFNASTCAPCELRHEAVACSSVLAPAPPCCRIPSPHQLRAPLQLARP